ncbi:MAG TPA: hypothetical protein VFT19_02285, partial [Solirubrobacterales bacterium]|nr:hypothetical protein [Solirubrobacterales bacterium]
MLIVEQISAWTSSRLKRRPKRYLIDPALIAATLKLGVAGIMRDGNLLGRVLEFRRRPDLLDITGLWLFHTAQHQIHRQRRFFPGGFPAEAFAFPGDALGLAGEGDGALGAAAGVGEGEARLGGLGGELVGAEQGFA